MRSENDFTTVHEQTEIHTDKNGKIVLSPSNSTMSSPEKSSDTYVKQFKELEVNFVIRLDCIILLASTILIKLLLFFSLVKFWVMDKVVPYKGLDIF